MIGSAADTPTRSGELQHSAALDSGFLAAYYSSVYPPFVFDAEAPSRISVLALYD